LMDYPQRPFFAFAAVEFSDQSQNREAWVELNIE